MTKPEISLKGKKVGVIGFNARPIACSIKRLGATTFVSDYWGDLDLASCSDEWIAVLSPIPGSRQRGSLENPVHFSLTENFLAAFSEMELDYILVGSGFDDHTSSLESIHKQYGITGNSPKHMKKSRNKKRIEQIIKARDLKIRLPVSYRCSSYSQVEKKVQKMGFPCVVRPCTSGGGSGVKLFTNWERLIQYLDNREKHDLVVQEYITGRDLSVSVLSTGTKSIALSLQAQLIGMPSSGRNCDFVYCGNYLPVNLSKSHIASMNEASAMINNELQLVGSNGFDFVLGANSEIILLEVNPRIQGTLELLELAGNISITKMHIDSTTGSLPKIIPEWKPTVKMISYAQKNGTVPDLSKYPSTVDRSPKGVSVLRGDPICTVIDTSRDVLKSYTKVVHIIQEINASI